MFQFEAPANLKEHFPMFVLKPVVCCAIGALGSEVTFSSGLGRVTGDPASGEELQSSLSDDDELEVGEDLSGGDGAGYALHEVHLSKDERKKKKGKGKRKNKNKSKSTTAINPEHMFHTNGYTSGHTSTHTTTEDPCTSTHQSYCIHGFCKYMEGLQEPVCRCMKGFGGERCGIQTLETGRPVEEEASAAQVVQTVLVIIAVVLSMISCTAILLMTCAHYRTHKNFLAAYLGTGTEMEKLQKPINNIV
ncbi:uncharacterized protein areg [Diretmus argenteus]